MVANEILDLNEIKYISYRFGFGTVAHTKEEISIKFNKDITLINAYEESILEKLRMNDKIKNLQ